MKNGRIEVGDLVVIREHHDGVGKVGLVVESTVAPYSGNPFYNVKFEEGVRLCAGKSLAIVSDCRESG